MHFSKRWFGLWQVEIMKNMGSNKTRIGVGYGLTEAIATKAAERNLKRQLR